LIPQGSFENLKRFPAIKTVAVVEAPNIILSKIVRSTMNHYRIVEDFINANNGGQTALGILKMLDIVL
jgi:hypothetical protein